MGRRKQAGAFFRPPALSAATVALVFASLAVASQPAEPTKDRPPEVEAKKSARLHEIYLRDASEYEFSLDAERRQALELRREPAMRWTSEGDYHGEVYVWTNRGQAAIVGCFFSGPQGEGARRVMHEFHSVASQPIVAAERRGTGWHSQEAGISLTPIPNAPKPDPSKTRRLTQMRAIARRFSSHVERTNRDWDLRLLPQPIYRYERLAEDSKVVDGAVFAFVWSVGTDPEVLLVIEARRTDQDQDAQWYFAPARFTNREAWVRHEDREVWRVKAATAGIFDGVTSKPYGVFSVKTIPNQEEKP